MYYFDTSMPEVVLPSMVTHRLEIQEFLKTQGLDFEEDVEYSIILRSDDEIIGTGSYSKNILKCIAVKKEYQGMGLSEKIVSLLVMEKYKMGEEHLFLFTNAENEQMFKNLGFHKIATSNQKTILMETPTTAVTEYVKNLESFKVNGKKIGCIVANCNPFTLGHLYLMEYAAKKCDVLYVFVLSEDLSVFPTDIRYRLVKEGTKHIHNIVVLESGLYIISAATFPTYFLKDKTIGSNIHAEIDVDFFGRHIVPALGITKRFIGTEPMCQLTSKYNKVLLKQLPIWGVEVEEVARLITDEEEISASKVRKLIKQGEYEYLKKYIPKVTYDFLTSDEAKNILNRIIQIT